MLEINNFKMVVKNTPLVSIDLCILFNGKILLGQRNNEPLKGFWFTPGGRIFKNEAYLDCLKRVASSELGLKYEDINQAKSMGIWDHFYKNSAFSSDISTHYVNLPHYINIKNKPNIIIDDQHRKMAWFELSEVAVDIKFHEYMRNYATWLINNII